MNDSLGDRMKKGFELVEVMIVVSIVGLIFAIGYPSFTKANRTDKLRKETGLTESRVPQIWYDSDTKEVTEVNPRDMSVSGKVGIITCSLKDFQRMSRFEQIKNIKFYEGATNESVEAVVIDGIEYVRKDT